MQRLKTTVRFTCPKCGGAAHTQVVVPEPCWGAAEKMSDMTSEDQTEVTCNLCGQDFPAYVQNSSSGCVVTFDDYSETRVSAEYAFYSPSEPDSWMNTQVPDDPFNVFMNSYYHLGDMLAEYGEGGRGILSHSGPLINRMVFTQQITALEAYLGDKLVQCVLGDQDSLNRLLANDNEMKAASIPLAVIARNPDVVRETVKKYLQEILYHNLAKVAKLYEIGLAVHIWPNDDVKKKMFVAVQRRHDCVHRNGRTKDGKPIDDLFTTAYVQELLEVILSFVKHIDNVLGDHFYRPKEA